MFFLILFAKEIFIYFFVVPILFIILLISTSIPREYPPRETVLLRVTALAAELCRAVEEKRIPTNGELGRQFGFSYFPGELAQRLRVYPAFSEGCDFHVVVYGDKSGIRISGRNRNDYTLTFTVGIYGPSSFGDAWLDIYNEPGTFYIGAIHIDPSNIKTNGRDCTNPFVPDAYGMASKPSPGCPYYWNWPKELIEPNQASGADPM